VLSGRGLCNGLIKRLEKCGVYEHDRDGPDDPGAGGRYFARHIVWLQNLMWHIMAKTHAQGARERGAKGEIKKKGGKKHTLSLSEGKRPLGRPRRRRQEKIKADSE
jgi:hypothetical protein